MEGKEMKGLKFEKTFEDLTEKFEKASASKMLLPRARERGPPFSCCS